MATKKKTASKKAAPTKPSKLDALDIAATDISAFFDSDVLIREWGLPHGKSAQKKLIPFDAKSIEEIRLYLDNPTKSGLWYLQAGWIASARISEHIWKEFENKIGNKGVLELPSQLHFKLTKEKKNALYESVNFRMTFIISLFTHLYHLDEQTTELPAYSSDDRLIFEIANIRQLKREFSEAYRFFESNLYFEGFHPQITQDKLFRIKEGAFISRESPSKAARILLVSTSRAALETIAQFLKLAGKISDYSLYPVFSPEEVVFEPYFTFLRASFPQVVSDQHASGLFERAFNEYSDENYSNCVSTIGLIAEDYLTQIYETFFRDVSPKGLTLGQTYDQIHSSIQKLFQPEPKKLSDITPVYNEIKQRLTEADVDPNALLNKETLKLIRTVLNMVREDREYFQDRIQNINKRSETISVFPKYLRDNLNELIRHRNAAAHKTRVPIGPYEALRTVYCLISLYLWWDAEKKAIDWKEDAVTILKKSIERNSKAAEK